ncbi:hypothetical protein M9458_025810, partial [Cirrhinus mrigala]
MELCHRSAARGPDPQGASISSVHPGAPGDGGVHLGDSGAGIHSTIDAAGRFQLLLRGQEGWGVTAMHRLRQLNSQIIQQPYPLPLVLRSAYNLIRIRAGDEWKTAFVTSSGHYEYRVMPYGLSISPSVFQMFMNEVFQEFLHRFVIVYIDDIMIYSWNLAEHRQHVQQVLHKLRDHSLYLKLEK